MDKRAAEEGLKDKLNQVDNSLRKVLQKGINFFNDKEEHETSETIKGFSRHIKYDIGISWDSEVRKIRDAELKVEVTGGISRRDLLIEQAKKLYEKIHDNFIRHYNSEGKIREDNQFSKRYIEIYQKAKQMVKVEASEE